MLKRYKRALIDLYRRIHELEADRLGKRLLALEIQEELLRRIVRAEVRIRQRRKLNAQTKRDLSNRANSRDISTNVRKVHQQGLDYVDGQKKLIFCLRSIGDAVAFIYGDRHELKQLVQNNNPGFISGKRGSRLERAILRKAFGWGATVVMNDLTNTLLIGDITAFEPNLWPNGGSPILPVEVKSGRGGNKKRAARQEQVRAETMNYILTDVRQFENGVHMRVAATEESRHHGDAITRLSASLSARGWASEEVESGLYYIIIDCALEELKASEAFKLLYEKGQRQWFILSANELRDEVLGYYPLPLLIRDAESLYRFYNGEFVIMVFVDVTYVNEMIAHKGVRIEPEHGPWRIVQLIPDEEWGERGISSRATGLFGAEFISLRWFIDNMMFGVMSEAMDELMMEQHILARERLNPPA